MQTLKCKLLNAKYYNVPQSRQRLIFIGIRNDLNKQPVFPKANKKMISPSKLIPELKGKKFLTFRYTRGTKDRVRSTHIAAPAVTGNLQMEDRITIKDEAILKILQSFPPAFTFASQLNGCMRKQIGNAVPPKFMQAIAETIKTEILET